MTYEEVAAHGVEREEGLGLGDRVHDGEVRAEPAGAASRHRERVRVDREGRVRLPCPIDHERFRYCRHQLQRRVSALRYSCPEI